MIELDGTYGNDNGFHYANRLGVPDTSFEVLGAGLRRTHYFAPDGFPLALAINHGVSYDSKWTFDGYNYNDAPDIRSIGSTNIRLSVSFWPHANPAQHPFLFTAAYVAPPDGRRSESGQCKAAHGGFRQLSPAVMPRRQPGPSDPAIYRCRWPGLRRATTIT